MAGGVNAEQENRWQGISEAQVEDWRCVAPERRHLGHGLCATVRGGLAAGLLEAEGVDAAVLRAHRQPQRLCARGVARGEARTRKPRLPRREAAPEDVIEGRLAHDGERRVLAAHCEPGRGSAGHATGDGQAGDTPGGLETPFGKLPLCVGAVAADPAVQGAGEDARLGRVRADGREGPAGLSQEHGARLQLLGATDEVQQHQVGSRHQQQPAVAPRCAPNNG
mmetsp:Transcript_95711/g.308984  ORF Transcript_95711/g.308984 Transcript_95711/m.308984 type:complete len:223 (-) Transcript_95711:1023-1691(-)